MAVSSGITGTSKLSSPSSRLSASLEHARDFHQKGVISCSSISRRQWWLTMKCYHSNIRSFKLYWQSSKVRRKWLSAACVLLLFFEMHKALDMWQEKVSSNFKQQRDERFKEDLQKFEPTVDTHLRPYPTIRDLIPKVHPDGRARIVPENHQRPFVFEAVGIPAMDIETNQSNILLFLYSQGTVAWTGLGGGCFHLNVTSCLVGSDRFSVAYDSNGVYTCSVARNIINGEILSVAVSPSAWKQQPSIEERRAIMQYLAGFEQLDDGSFVLESDVKWNAQMLQTAPEEDEGRYKICMMTQEKNFPEYIPEWLAYHRRIGVDYVYIYDNNAYGNLSKTYHGFPDVEIVYWPWERSQIQAQNHFLLVGRRRCQWGLLIDVDEYLMIRPTQPETSERPLKKFLRLKREKQDYSQVRVTSIALGSSGNIYRPREPIAEAYWHLANLQDNLTKPIVWLGHSYPNSYVHHVVMAPGYYSEWTNSVLDNPETTEIALCHMKYRSWEDYVLKGRGGRNSFHVGEWWFSAKWSIHSPNTKHLTVRNSGTFVEFRKLWRRLILQEKPDPELSAFNAAQLRYERVTRHGFAWKRRRNLRNTTMHTAIIEEEKCFRRLKDWEVRKKERLAKMNIEIEF